MNPPSTPADPALPRPWTRRAWLAGSLAGLAAGLAGAGCSRFRRGPKPGSAGTIRVLAWAGYFTDLKETADENGIVVRTDHKDAVIQAFEDDTGVEVDFTLFESNEQLYQRLTAEGADYDLAMPSGFLAKWLHTDGWLRRIPPKLLPNARNVDWRRFKFAFDPAHEFAIPYIWGSTGIAYNVAHVPRMPTRWSDLFTDFEDPDGEKLSIALMDDGRFTMGVALIHLGFSPNTQKPAEIEAAGKFLISLRDRIDLLETEYLVPKLENETVHLALSTSGDVTKAMRTNKHVRLALPAQGSLVFKDTFVLPLTPEEKRAAAAGRSPAWDQRHVNAVRFLDYLLRPEIAGRVSNFSCYATTLPGARAYVDRWITNGAAYFINPAGRDFHLEETSTVSPVFARTWAEVRQRWR